MKEFQMDPVVLFAILEFTFVVMALAIVFVIRSIILSKRILKLKDRKPKTIKEDSESVSFDQYLRDEIIRNEEIIDRLDASEAEPVQQHASLLKVRKKFLELEIEARELGDNPVAFEEKLGAGMQELIESLKPDEEEPVEQESADADLIMESVDEIEDDSSKSVDTESAEIGSLKDVINNQQDALKALRAELEALAASDEGATSLLDKLDEFEQQSIELQHGLYTLADENDTLKSDRQGGGEVTRVDKTDSLQTAGLKSMSNKQQETISTLQAMLQELAPEANKAQALEDAFMGIQQANTELDGCVKVLEDENASLRRELDQIMVQMDEQPDDDEPPKDDFASLADIEQLEIKVQELEALVEFKDATIEEMEKQHNILKEKYLSDTGKQKVS